MTNDENLCACLGTLHVVGWMNVDTEGKPVRQIKYRHGEQVMGPIRVYQTKAVAARYGIPKPVYTKD